MIRLIWIVELGVIFFFLLTKGMLIDLRERGREGEREEEKRQSVAFRTCLDWD